MLKDGNGGGTGARATRPLQATMGDILKSKATNIPSDLAPSKAIDLSQASERQVEQRIAELISRAGKKQLAVTMILGPVAAEYFLSRSIGNRSESSGFIQCWAGAMTNNEWKHNSVTMGWDWNGAFRDGHHRCRAIALSKATITVNVVFGAEPESFDTVDRGRARDLNAVFKLAGLEVGKKHIPVVRAAMQIASGKTSHVRRTDQEVRGALEQYAPALAALPAMSQWPAGMWGALVYAYGVFPTEVTVFGQQMKANVTEDVHSSIRVLRHWIEQSSGTGSAGQKMGIETTKRTFYALKAFIEKRVITKFAPKDDGTVELWFRQRVDGTIIGRARRKE